MLITKDSIYYGYKKAQLSKWPCPNCYSIGLKKLEIRSYENNYSKSKRKTKSKEGVFVGILKCIHEDCSCIISVCGDYRMSQNKNKIVEDFFPLHFNPPIPIFKVAEYEEISFELIEVINMAFRLFWTDLNACSNKIRIVIEQILNDKKIRKTKKLDKPKYGRKTEDISLHKRIILFGEKYPGLDKHLTAIKWIGNEGSHKYEGLDVNDLLDAFAILEDVLESLYGYRSKELNSTIKRINKRKKP